MTKYVPWNLPLRRRPAYRPSPFHIARRVMNRLAQLDELHDFVGGHLAVAVMK
jgi:hypothetical protein